MIVKHLLRLFCLILICMAASQALGQPADEVLQAEQRRIEVTRRASAATVAVFDSSGQGGGSGVLISPDGFALTNFHVTASCGAAMKCGLDDGKAYDAVIVGIDPVGDVALIQLLGRDDFPNAPLGDSDLVQVGDWVFTAGNPFLLADDFQPSIAYGIVSGVERYQYPAGTLLEYADCIQTDAAINPGNSGGPLFDDEGNVIGINGRGSFEKRGRVNVGVGYAISINQIKHFLPHLKSGRIVDHATLGATVTTGNDGRVTIDEILDTSDAYRRGLRYGDQLVRFAGREITTANRLKNALGIFPRGWLVPIEYQRDGKSYEKTVRLAGVHDESQLYDLVQRQESQPIEPPRPEPPKREGEEAPEEQPQLPKLPRPLAKKPDLPDAVTKQYVERRGYANYWYNKQKQQQLWDGYAGHEVLKQAGLRWNITSEEVQLEIDPQQAKIVLPEVAAGAVFTGDVSSQLSPPNSGGLLLTIHLWQRLVEKGLRQYGEVYYLGQLPRRTDGMLVDCLVGIYSGIETCFQFDNASGDLVGIVMQPREGVDPCELHLLDYRELEGRRLPSRWQVLHGDELYLEFEIKQWTFDTHSEGESNE